MIALLALTICITGTLSQYDQRPTDEVLRNRTTPGDTAYTLPDTWRTVDGFMAVQSCSDIGTIYTVSWRGHTARLMAFDCPGDATTRRWMKRGNIVAELDWYTARAWGAFPRRGLRGAVVCHE